jgi:hypothetical protein
MSNGSDKKITAAEALKLVAKALRKEVELFKNDNGLAEVSKEISQQELRLQQIAELKKYHKELSESSASESSSYEEVSMSDVGETDDAKAEAENHPADQKNLNKTKKPKAVLPSDKNPEHVGHKDTGSGGQIVKKNEILDETLEKAVKKAPKKSKEAKEAKEPKKEPKEEKEAPQGSKHIVADPKTAKELKNLQADLDLADDPKDKAHIQGKIDKIKGAHDKSKDLQAAKATIPSEKETDAEKFARAQYKPHLAAKPVSPVTGKPVKPTPQPPAPHLASPPVSPVTGKPTPKPKAKPAVKPENVQAPTPPAEQQAPVKAPESNAATPAPAPTPKPAPEPVLPTPESNLEEVKGTGQEALPDDSFFTNKEAVQAAPAQTPAAPAAPAPAVPQEVAQAVKKVKSKPRNQPKPAAPVVTQPAAPPPSPSTDVPPEILAAINANKQKAAAKPVSEAAAPAPAPAPVSSPAPVADIPIEWGNPPKTEREQLQEGIRQRAAARKVPQAPQAPLDPVPQAPLDPEWAGPKVVSRKQAMAPVPPKPTMMASQSPVFAGRFSAAQQKRTEPGSLANTNPSNPSAVDAEDMAIRRAAGIGPSVGERLSSAAGKVKQAGRNLVNRVSPLDPVPQHPAQPEVLTPEERADREAAGFGEQLSPEEQADRQAAGIKPSIGSRIRGLFGKNDEDMSKLPIVPGTLIDETPKQTSPAMFPKTPSIAPKGAGSVKTRPPSRTQTEPKTQVVGPKDPDFYNPDFYKMDEYMNKRRK